LHQINKYYYRHIPAANGGFMLETAWNLTWIQPELETLDLEVNEKIK